MAGWTGLEPAASSVADANAESDSRRDQRVCEGICAIVCHGPSPNAANILLKTDRASAWATRNAGRKPSVMKRKSMLPHELVQEFVGGDSSRALSRAVVCSGDHDARSPCRPGTRLHDDLDVAAKLHEKSDEPVERETGKPAANQGRCPLSVLQRRASTSSGTCAAQTRGRRIERYTPNGTSRLGDRRRPPAPRNPGLSEAWPTRASVRTAPGKSQSPSRPAPRPSGAVRLCSDWHRRTTETHEDGDLPSPRILDGDIEIRKRVGGRDLNAAPHQRIGTQTRPRETDERNPASAVAHDFVARGTSQLPSVVISNS